MRLELGFGFGFGFGFGLGLGFGFGLGLGLGLGSGLGVGWKRGPFSRSSAAQSAAALVSEMVRPWLGLGSG